MINKLCAPAILYVGFSLTQIIIDIFKRLYDIAFFKSIVMIVFTIILNVLCSQGLGVVSWLIVFLPFIMMTYITAILMITLGFGNDTTTETKNKVIYPSNYPKILHKHRQPIINGHIGEDNNTMYETDNIMSNSSMSSSSMSSSSMSSSKPDNNSSNNEEPEQANGYDNPQPAV